MKVRSKWLFLAAMSIDHRELEHFIRIALTEDIGDGDHTSLSTIPVGKKGSAGLWVKEPGVIAGAEVARKVYQVLDPDLEFSLLIPDGSEVQPGDVVFTVNGSVHTILAGERVALNFMQRMSGIASFTRQIVKTLEGTGTRVLDTRKTTPGIRFLEKWAVRIGGGDNHRAGLYDMILIKDNHVDYAGGISRAIAAAKEYLEQNDRPLEIEIEVRNMQELGEVLEAGGVDRILLDNFSPRPLKEAVDLIRHRYITEASGNITLETVKDYAGTGVDFISMGSLTHSVKSLDLSLKAIKQ